MTRVRVLVPFRSGGDLQRQLNVGVVLDWWHNLTSQWPEVVDDPDPLLFNRGRAIGAHLAANPPQDGEVLVLADGDLIPQAHAVERALGILTLQPQVWAYAVPFTTVDYLSSADTARVHQQLVDPHDADVLAERTWNRLSTGGINIVPAATWWVSGGFDPRFRGWGFEDAAFDAAARTLTAKRTLHVGGPVIHLHHPPSPETNPGDPGYQRSLELCHRYEQVDGDPDAMRRLTMDWRTP